MAVTSLINIHRTKKYDVYIGRPSIWGNPFSHKDIPSTIIAPEYHCDTREEAILRYNEWLLKQPHLLAKLPELYGKVLGCWCYPLPCHGEVLMQAIMLHKFGYLRSSESPPSR